MTLPMLRTPGPHVVPSAAKPAFVELGVDLARARRDGAPAYRLETLLERTHPFRE